MANFEEAHKFVAKWEGGICNVKGDRGGLTHYGVSMLLLKDMAGASKGKKFLASLGLAGEANESMMRKVDRKLAAEIFRWKFWSPLELELCRQSVAQTCYDIAVNHGMGGAARLMQQGFNDLHPNALAVDGLIGPATRAAMRNSTKDEAMAICQRRIIYYYQIVRNRPDQKKFLAGWLNRANDLIKVVKKTEV